MEAKTAFAWVHYAPPIADNLRIVLQYVEVVNELDDQMWFSGYAVAQGRTEALVWTLYRAKQPDMLLPWIPFDIAFYSNEDRIVIGYPLLSPTSEGPSVISVHPSHFYHVGTAFKDAFGVSPEELA